MATYECNKCGMSVSDICEKYYEKLLNDRLVVENGSVHISKCLNGHGKFKSPLCCGSDMHFIEF